LRVCASARKIDLTGRMTLCGADFAEPNGSGAQGMPHHHNVHHAQRRRHMRHTAPASSGTTQP
jgi:hypothetical protein